MFFIPNITKGEKYEYQITRRTPPYPYLLFVADIDHIHVNDFPSFECLCNEIKQLPRNTEYYVTYKGILLEITPYENYKENNNDHTTP